MYRTLVALFSSLAAPIAASEFSLSWPIDCTLGETCYIQQYVDRDHGPGAVDFTCNKLTYDGHKGTDIALPYLSDMTAGVPVRAAADGVVAGVRNNMDDTYATKDNSAQIKGRECGNGVVLRHVGGWETQYCHMKKGSIGVKTGDRVATGSTLGEVGLSGQTQFPHLHVSVRQDGQVVDPFMPDPKAICGASPKNQLWSSPISYVAGAFIGAGFSHEVPRYDAIKSGDASEQVDSLTPKAPALVLWAFAYGGLKGDTITLTVEGPDGMIIDQTVTLEKDQAQFFRAAGKRLRASSWPTGLYTGTSRLVRNGREVDRVIRTIRF